MEEDVGVKELELVPAQQIVVVDAGELPHLRDTIGQLRDRAYWIASFAADFNSTAAAIDARSNDLRLAEDKAEAEREELARMREELDKAQEAARVKWREVEQREEALELLMKKQRKQLESVEAEKASIKAELRELGRSKKDFEKLGEIIQNRAAKAQEDEEAVEVKRKEVEAKEKEMEERINRILLREKGFEDQLTESKVKHAEFQVRSTQLSVRARKIDDRERRLSELESKLRSREMGFEQRVDAFSKKKAELDLRLAEVSKKEREVDEREKHSKEVECKVELREKGFQDRFLEFVTKQREFKEKEREMEEKEVYVEKWLMEIQHREEGFRKKAEELELRNKGIEAKEQQSKELQLKLQQCSDDLMVREKRLNGQLEVFKVEQATRSSELRVKETDIDEKDKVLRRLELEVRQRYDELKSREKHLEQRTEEYKAKEAKSDQRLEEIEKKENRQKETEVKVEQLSRALRAKETREKQFKELECEVQDCKKRLAQCQEYESKYRSLKLKEMELEDKHDKRIKDVELKDTQVDRLYRESELKDKKRTELLSLRVKAEPLDSSTYHTSLDHSSEADIRFCVTMGGKDLQIFLNERFEHHDSMKDEVETALKLSSDPPKLVLDAMQGFYPPHLKKGNVEFEEAVIKKSCIMLLETLRKMSPEIKPATRKEAMKLAVDWMARMRPDFEHSLEVLAVLQLMAAYDLASAFEVDELVSHLGVVAHYSQAPKLLQDLGLGCKISSVIQELLEKNFQAEAARFISAFELHAKFPSVTSPKGNEASPLFGNMAAAASTNPGIISTSNTVPSGQCSGAKRSWLDACADGNYSDYPDPAPVTSANLPAQQVEMLKSPDRQPEGVSLPGQQPEGSNLSGQQSALLPGDQGCVNPSLISAQASSLSSITFVPQCLKKAGTRIKHFCEKIASNELFCRETTDAFRLAADPAEFVLGVVKNPSTLLLKRGSDSVSLTFPEYGPILLLNCMWRKRKSARVKPDVEREALSFAKDWNSKIVKRWGRDNLEVICFLLFLAAYKLVSHFDQDVFFSVFEKEPWCEYGTKLFGILRFKGFIPKFLHYLMRKELQSQVLECINVSDLLVKSPYAQTLLKEHLLKYPKSRRTGSNAQQIEGIDSELRVWEAIVQSIRDQNLAKKFRAHLLALRKAKEECHELKNWKPNAAPISSDQVNQQETVTDAATLSAATTSPCLSSSESPVKTSTTASTSTAPKPQQESPQKRCRVVSSNESLWSYPNFRPPQQPLQFNRGNPVRPPHYPNPGYGFPGYPHPPVFRHPSQAVPCFPHSPYAYPGHGRSVPF